MVALVRHFALSALAVAVWWTAAQGEPAAGPAAEPAPEPAPEPAAEPTAEPAAAAAGTEPEGEGAEPEGAGEAVGEGEPEAEPKLGEPGFVPPNLPQCITAWADTMSDLDTAINQIIVATVACNSNRGWFGEVLFRKKIGSTTNAPFLGSNKNAPFHNQRVCALGITSAVSNLASTASDLLDASLACFNDNQGCGQAIASTINYLVSAGNRLINVAGFCPPIGANPPWNSNLDAPKNGFFCWKNVWSFIQLLVKSAKYIDTAVATCQVTAPEPEAEGEAEGEPEPEPAPGGADTPLPIKTQQAVAADQPPEPEPAPTLGAAATGGTTGWDTLGQAAPFGIAGSAAAERRLSADRKEAYRLFSEAKASL